MTWAFVEYYGIVAGGACLTLLLLAGVRGWRRR